MHKLLGGCHEQSLTVQKSNSSSSDENWFQPGNLITSFFPVTHYPFILAWTFFWLCQTSVVSLGVLYKRSYQCKMKEYIPHWMGQSQRHKVSKQNTATGTLTFWLRAILKSPRKIILYGSTGTHALARRSCKKRAPLHRICYFIFSHWSDCSLSFTKRQQAGLCLKQWSTKHSENQVNP